MSIDKKIKDMENKISKQLRLFIDADSVGWNANKIIARYLTGFNNRVRIPKKLWNELFGGAR